MKKRERYLEQIKPFIDKPLIKVITGIRRSGKSTFLKMIQDEIFSQGVSKNNVIVIQKESLRFEFIQNYKDLYDYVNEIKSTIQGKLYLFVDEIQIIEGWEKAITSFLADEVADIYISGSNAGLLSSELATLLTGRYVEINIYTLVFSEFLDFRKSSVSEIEIEIEFNLFLKYGGFPGIHHLKLEDDLMIQYLNSIYNTVLLKDVISRNQVRNVALLEKIARFIIDNTGNITSAKGIKDYIKSQQISASVDTVQNYIQWLTDAFISYKTLRYDIKGKRILQMYEKYFLSDIGFIFGLLGNRIEDISGKLENIVYLEMRSRGYQVSIGKLNNLEIDFIATNNIETIYIQVAYQIPIDNPKVYKREFGNLEKIKDNHKKIVLSLDKHLAPNKNGIEWQNLMKFLLDFK